MILESYSEWKDSSNPLKKLLSTKFNLIFFNKKMGNMIDFSIRTDPEIWKEKSHAKFCLMCPDDWSWDRVHIDSKDYDLLDLLSIDTEGDYCSITAESVQTYEEVLDRFALWNGDIYTLNDLESFINTVITNPPNNLEDNQLINGWQMSVIYHEEKK